MKKLSFFLMAMLFTCSTTLQAEEVTETIAMKGFGGLTTATYENVTQTGTSDLGTEMVAYAFNPSNGQIRGNKTVIAGASITSTDKNKNWSLYNTQAMPGAIKKITVTQTATGNNKFKGKLFVALGTTNQGDVTTVEGAQENTTGTATEFTFDIDETQGYTYFKLLSNVAFTSGSVAGAVVTVTYVTAEGGEEEVTKYTVTANVNDPAMGTVSGAGEYAEGKTATLTANANPGYKFVNWSNGSTDNPLKITVTEDVEVTANFEAIPPMTCAEAAATAAGTTVVLKPFDVVAVVKDAGYIYIEDESGVNLIYDYNLAKELKAGDHVEGFVGSSSPYNGLPELKTSVAYADLTVTHGTAPEPTLFTEAPVKADVNKYVKFENVTFTANVTYTAGSTGSNATMVVNGTNVTLRNNFKLAATLSKDKAYNIVGFVGVYNSTIQVYFLSIEEYVAPVVNHTITVSANPAEAGTVTGAGEYEEGTEVTLTATPAEGYEFVNWTENEAEVSTDAEYTFEVLADRALVANFTEVVVEPTTETVYFVNAQDWSGTITAHAWEGNAAGTTWPGLPTVKEADQIGGKDVYSFTAEAGAYAKVIFTNGSGDKTGDLVWTAGKYYVADGWYTKEEAEDKLATPIPDTWTVAGGPESIFGSNWNTNDTNNDMVMQADGTYKWEKTGLELVANSTISFKVVKNHAWGEAYPGSNYDLSIPENGIYTITITFDPSAKTVNAVATKTGDAEVEVTISYVLMGVAGDWGTGIALTQNPDNANEYVLLDQEILAGDAVKVVTLVNGEKSAYCGNVEEWTTVAYEKDDDGNIVLAPGLYDFYYKVDANVIYIGGEAYPEIYTVTLLNDAGAELEGAGEYEEGSVATVIAPEMEEWYFVAWTDEEGNVVSNDATTTVTVNQDITLTALYAMMMPLEVTDLEIVMDPVFGLIGSTEVPMGTLSLQLVVDASAEPGEDGEFPLTEDSQIWLGEDTQFEFLEGIALIDMENNAAQAIVLAADEFGLYYLVVNMSAAAPEPVEVVVENAIITVEELSDGMGGTYESVNVTAEWNGTLLKLEGIEKNFEGFLQITQIVDEATDDWYIWMAMNGTVTTVDNVLTVSGEFTNNLTGDVYNVTISGTLPGGTTTGLDNINTTIAPAKAIVNGQLVIVKDGVQYNAQGAVIK